MVHALIMLCLSLNTLELPIHTGMFIQIFEQDSIIFIRLFEQDNHIFIQIFEQEKFNEKYSSLIF